MSQQTCANCGAPRASAENSFCVNCGTPYAAAPEQPTEVIDTSSFAAEGGAPTPPPAAPDHQSWGAPPVQNPQSWGAPAAAGQQSWGAPPPGGPGPQWTPAPDGGDGGGGSKGAKIALVVGLVVLLLVAGGVAAALVLGGDDDKDDKSDSKGPDTTSEPTTDEFCEAVADLGEVNLDQDLTGMKAMAAKLREIGAPAEMSDDARAGMDLYVRFVEEADSVDDLEEAGDQFTEEEDRQGEAFFEFYAEHCMDLPGTPSSDIPTPDPAPSDSPTDLPTGLPTDFPTDLESLFPSDLLENLPSELESLFPDGLPTELFNPEDLAELEELFKQFEDLQNQ